MNIQTVIDNLTRTIDGKRQLLATLEREASTWNIGIVEMVRMNVEELERVRADLILCQTHKHHDQS